MKNNQQDINDDEIRFISSSGRVNSRQKNYKLLVRIGIIAVAVIAAIVAVWLLLRTFVMSTSDNYIVADYDAVMNREQIGEKPACLRIDTVVDGFGLTILTPYNATPVLEIGKSVEKDTTAVLYAQAADVRADNETIACMFVLKGELISRGEAKAGFCSIIDGNITVGVADASPMLEQVLTNEGYFFRQFPLVVANQVVENKLKGRYLRKALAERADGICVVISHEAMTMGDFSQVLVDAGVRNAIYLTGGSSLSGYKDVSGKITRLGKRRYDFKYENYIVWR